MKSYIYYIGLTLFFTSFVTAQPKPGKTNKASTQTESTRYTNPIMWADVPDLSITRSGSDYYLISTTMHLMPGAPIMHSKDLVHWQTVSYVFDSLTDNRKYNLEDGTVYGKGQWASSIRYHKGNYYVLFSPNDEPFKSYIYKANNPSGKWQLVSRTKHFHDASLFFDDDDTPYVYSGTHLTELKKDLSDVKPGGVDVNIFDKDASETGLLEGNQVIKYNNKYYLLMISWPQGGKRRQVCYRADKITGPYEKKVILEDNFAGFPYVGQGCIIDDINGNWYGLVFQDREAVGRVPLLMPCRWVDGWPMLGDDNGHVPLSGSIPLKEHNTGWNVVESDDFSSNTLKINWQWNHTPVNNAWSLTARKGYLRLKTNRVVANLYEAPNTLTQRMEGPKCSGVVALDISKMRDGDVAGISAFNGHSAILGITCSGNKKVLSLCTNVVSFYEGTKNISGIEKEEKENVEIASNRVYLRIDANFNLNKDIATFYYSLDNKNWLRIGGEFKMKFDYRKLFMGTKFAIFNYATKSVGGYVDVDFFEYKKLTD
ncbi:family 43 glycosylhydrolase [Flavobacterium sp. Sd200]|uniref:glycoside hydrolase family 43 protein n=1 Tax=Flavobacterium sp. Sd200 TaxID=2692211 RepID=UPI00136DB3E4|nr:glycoside hydrolase 43 family protein [Flavobacterium sp. Sd200]MXN90404.1 family 43 glycosylhydrolase [Flavobacterium sp. Sd200]